MNRPAPDPAGAAGPIARAALGLGILGLVPFTGLALAAHLAPAPPLRAAALTALAVWGAVILGFMAGARWAMMLTARPAPGLARLAVVGILPPMLALLAPLLPAAAGLGLLMAGFAGLLAFELTPPSRAEAPGWYPRLRVILSGGAMAGLLLGLIAA